MSFLAWLLAGAACSYVVCDGARRLALRTSKFLDPPSWRSFRAHPIPRIGGAGVTAVAVVAGAALPFPLLLAGAGFLAVVAVSAWDDYRGLAAWPRLAVHIFAAVWLAAVLAADAPASAWLITAGITVWSVNLFNFMDGSDGLVPGMSGVGLVVLALALFSYGEASVACFTVALAGACLGFLGHNHPPARAFLGDAGAAGIGFLVAAISFWGLMQGVWPWWFPPLVFAPMLADATITLLRRALQGANLTQPHQAHLYQRAQQSGLPARWIAYVGWMAVASTGLMSWALRDGYTWPIPVLVALSVAWVWLERRMP